MNTTIEICRRCQAPIDERHSPNSCLRRAERQRGRRANGDMQHAGRVLSAAALRARSGSYVPRKCGACGKRCELTHTKIEYVGLTCVAVDVWFVCGPACAAKLQGSAPAGARP